MRQAQLDIYCRDSCRFCVPHNHSPGKQSANKNNYARRHLAQAPQREVQSPCHHWLLPIIALEHVTGLVSPTVLRMIVNHASALHKCITGGRPNKPEPFALEQFRHSLRFWRLAWGLGRRLTYLSSVRGELPQQTREIRFSNR